MNDSKGLFPLLFLPLIAPAAAISLLLVGGLSIFASLDMRNEMRKDAAKARARIAAKKIAAENRANPDYVDPRAIRLEQLRPKLRTGNPALFKEYDAIRKDMIENPDNLPAELPAKPLTKPSNNPDPRAIRLAELRPKLRTGDAALFREYDALKKDMIKNPNNLPV